MNHVYDKTAHNSRGAVRPYIEAALCSRTWKNLTPSIERRPGSEIRRQAEKEGLSSLRESAVKKVFTGMTTLHEINRVTFVEEIR